MESGWESKGYFGGGNVVSLIDSQPGKTAIVAGSAYGVFQEIEEAKAKVTVDQIFAANDIGVYLPEVDHMVSLHADNLTHWAALRSDKRSRDLFKTHSIYDHDYNWKELTPTFVLSGYFAMQIAFIMGFQRVILCGCPGDDTRRFFDAQPRPNGPYHGRGTVQQLQDEIRRIPELLDVVRSMSGYTREVFGAL
jgi:hypothetical protein